MNNAGYNHYSTVSSRRHRRDAFLGEGVISNESVLRHVLRCATVSNTMRLPSSRLAERGAGDPIGLRNRVKLQLNVRDPDGSITSSRNYGFL